MLGYTPLSPVRHPGVSASVQAGIHTPWANTLGRHPPAVTAAEGTHPTGMDSSNYHLQRSCEGYVFTGMCLSTGGCLPQCMLGYKPPPRADPREQTSPEQTPPKQTPPEQTPSRADTPQSRHPQSRHPPRSRPPSRHPRSKHTPPGADTSSPPRDGHCCERYASYWECILVMICVLFVFSIF